MCDYKRGFEPDTTSLVNYRYYDTPDGCDMWKKVFVTSRYGLLVGAVLSTKDVLMFSHATTWPAIARRYAFHTTPYVAMGATFAIVANSVQNWRQKDDGLNYFLGGLACGPILAAYVGSVHGMVVGGLALGVAGLVKKYAVQNDYHFFPDIQSHMGTVTSWRHDWTLAKDPRDAEPCKGHKKA
ncbi:NADH dehydrogenase [ubiquinone] 1 alpha subcomplex subunit 11-like [Aricia agestis]|uniref:NADH dehydrogenase [ubiquinone] 1 alpha subcomplex subunit 11-like n=1 Tax=Aricia agestis TaxID=91739 RepID=UPI001C208771|nr:NADH dehydrogenase [ubiquinone] 1 alpha subcomplex subunit 11-like [Aricia agestis]